MLMPERGVASGYIAAMLARRVLCSLRKVQTPCHSFSALNCYATVLQDGKHN
jgi:hypothetical protein